MEKNAWIGKSWGDSRKQTQRARTWHVAADCSKYGQHNREGLINDGRQPCTTDSQQEWGSRVEASAGLKTGCELELITEVRWCCPMQTLVHKNIELELDLLWSSQLSKCSCRRSSDVVEPKHEPHGRVHDWLEQMVHVLMISYVQSGPAFGGGERGSRLGHKGGLSLMQVKNGNGRQPVEKE